MAKEIERKFLVKNDSYRQLATNRRHIMQGYLGHGKDNVVRVRIADDEAFLTVKSKTRGFERDEYEYRIPVDDAEAMMNLCDGMVIDKYRYIVEHDGHVWEVDEFLGNIAPLVVAEIELASKDETFTLPDFIDIEVTGNPMFYNSRLAMMSKNQKPVSNT